MKHVFTPNSPLKNKTTRASARQFQTLLTVQKKGTQLVRIFGFFASIFFLLVLICTLGFISLWSSQNESEMIMFNYIDNDGSISKNTLAYYDKNSEKINLYHFDFKPEYLSQGVQVSPTKESLYFRVLISAVVEVPSSNSQQSSKLNESADLTKKKLEKSLWLSQTRSPHTTFLQKSFWKNVWWWWHIKVTSSANLREKNFTTLESWYAYPLQKDIQITTMPCSIAVVNTTPITGVATEIGTILERSGFFVARLTTNRSDTNTSLLLTKGVAECDGIAQLLKILTPNSNKIVVDESAALRYRARVVLLVGNDIVTSAPDLQSNSSN